MYLIRTCRVTQYEAVWDFPVSVSRYMQITSAEENKDNRIIRDPDRKDELKAGLDAIIAERNKNNLKQE